MITLSLCIPAYNAEKYLPRLLKSASAQLIPFDEILVYNDCSTDQTAQIALSYNAKVISGDLNKGCSYGKNQMALATTCDWIHFHDADDELMPNFTTLAHNWLSQECCPDIVLFDYEYRDDKNNELLGIRNFNKKELEANPLRYAIAEQINPFCGLYRKTSILKYGGYDTDPLILYNEDSAFHIKMATNGLTFSAENKISIINYRINNSMSASNVNKCFEAQYHVLARAAIDSPEYAKQIATRLWNIIDNFGSVDNWAYVKMSLALCERIGYCHPPEGNKIFQVLTRINPLFAIRLRENAIRLFKPYLRQND